MADLDAELGTTLADAKLASERRRATLLGIEAQIRRGGLIARADAEREHFTIVRRLRDRILGLAPRVAAEAHAAETLAECQRAIDREIRLALAVLADELNADANR